MFEISISKRISQLFCKHNYYPVVITDHYQEIGTNNNHERATIYKCQYCEHVRIVKKENESYKVY